MIPASAGQKNVPEWQRALANAVRDPAELLGLLELDAGVLNDRVDPAQPFPLRVPRGYVARMRRGDVRDPLLAQVLPLAAEGAAQAGFVRDPVGDQGAMPRPGVLHKYAGRVLLVTTGACAIHCRYCFRRHFPYAQANPRTGTWREALDYIAADSSIEEVILSGGDPLSLPDPALADLVARVEAIAHVRTLRLHTRMPVVLPERVDAALLDWLGNTRLSRVVVLHANHGREIDHTVDAAVERLRALGVTLLNQAVLLRGVNDTVEAQAELSHRLFASGTLPYYLHILDPVRGAAHFEVSSTEARALMRDLAARLPGYLVPRLVREEPGRPGKTPLGFEWDSTNNARTKAIAI